MALLRTSSNDPAVARVLSCKCAPVVHLKCRVCFQQKTCILLRGTRRSMASLDPSRSPCSPKISGSSTWLIRIHQRLQQLYGHQWRLQLGHVKRLIQPMDAHGSLLPRLRKLCLCSTTTGLGQGQGGLQSCCALLTGRSLGRMARFSASMCWHIPFAAISPFSKMR